MNGRRLIPFMWFIALGALLLTGCVASGPLSPEEVVERYRRALQDKNTKIARGLRVTPKGAQNPIVVKRWPMVVPKEHHRVATWVKGKKILLAARRDGATWRLSDVSLVLHLFSTPTPQKAVAVFAYAISQDKYGVLLQLLPKAERAQWSPKMLKARLMDAKVRASWMALANAIGENELTYKREGAEIRVQVGRLGRIHLLEETDGWKVVDVTPRQTYGPVPGNR